MDSYQSVSRRSRPLAFGQVLVCGFGNAGGLLGISGHAVWVLYTGLLGTAVIVLGGVTLAIAHGATGMALTVIVALILLYGLLAIPCRKLLGVHTLSMHVAAFLLACGAAALITALKPQWHLYAGVAVLLITIIYGWHDRSLIHFIRTHRPVSKP